MSNKQDLQDLHTGLTQNKSSIALTVLCMYEGARTQVRYFPR